jgi:hypothetical protein
VKYQGKSHDASNQSDDQKYALIKFLNNNIGKSPSVCNFIWFRSISSVANLVSSDNGRNLLPNAFTLKDLFTLACNQNLPLVKSSNILSGSFSSLKHMDSSLNKIEDIFNLFERVVQAVGDSTRDKIEYITKKLLDKQNYARAIGEKLIIISGRAGTGKTIKLLRIASDLAINQNSRCLILTYNHALASDIKRMLALAKFSDGFDTPTVRIDTIYKFMRKLIKGFGIKDENALQKDYLENYDEYLDEIYNYIEEELINGSDIQSLMKKYHDTISWDYILIDESQDWDFKEKQVLYKVFGYKKIIIADGIDQLVRSQVRCEWAKDLVTDQIAKTFEKKSLRQKSNLLNFVTQYAKKSNIHWDIEAEEGIISGKVIVINGEYDYQIHKNEFDRCKENGNSAYEMLFLVPPMLVSKEKVPDKYNKIKIKSTFKLTEQFKQNGIKIWDGTSKELRNEYPVDLNEHRVLQYESCRGLEGWTVVCLELDEFIKYKYETYEKNDILYDDLLETDEDRKNRFVDLWSLIPLTRAIDTLIITIKNKDSLLARKLYEIYKNSDYIEWIDKN